MGRRFHGDNLIDAWNNLLDHICETARNEQADALLVAGDIYDPANPSLDAVRPFSRGLTQIGRPRHSDPHDQQKTRLRTPPRRRLTPAGPGRGAAEDRPRPIPRPHPAQPTGSDDGSRNPRPPTARRRLRAAAGRRQNARRPCPQGRHTDRSTHRPIDHRATINEEGGITPTTAGGTPYRLSLIHISKTRQGVNEWHAEDEAGAHVSPRALRDRAVVAAAL